MCQANASVAFRAVVVWTLLGSLTFGFCSIWSLHFVAMLAYELDISIGISVPLTILSSVLAVVFTFAALASDLLWDTHFRERKRKTGNHRRRRTTNRPKNRHRGSASDMDFRPLLSHTEDTEEFSPELATSEATLPEFQLDGVDIEENIPMNDSDQVEPSISPQNVARSNSTSKILTLPVVRPSTDSLPRNQERTPDPAVPDSNNSTPAFTDSSEHSVSGRSVSFGSSSTSTFGLSSIVNLAYQSTTPAKNVFIATGEALYLGYTRKNIAKGFLWSLAITSMHYAGILALSIPSGYCTLNYIFVVLSAIISWVVCVVGCILMSHMETHLGQQFLFSVAATTGVAGMHFTGKPDEKDFLNPPTKSF
jgi:NO-binding membrane sensor protein with MHYT domain